MKMHKQPAIQASDERQCRSGVNASLAERDQTWGLVPTRESGVRPPFFAGGSHPRYDDVANFLGPDQPFYRLDLYALQERRLESGLPLYTTVEEMGTHFACAVRSVQPCGPYLLGGGCESAIVALEIARQLQRTSNDVPLLLIWENPPLRGRIQTARHLVARTLVGLGSTEGRATIARMIKTRALPGKHYEGTVRDNRRAIASLIYQAIAGYRSSDLYRGRIVLLRRNQLRLYEDPTAGWAKLATEGIEVHEIPGKFHDYGREHLMDFAHLPGFCEVTKGCIERALRGARPAQQSDCA